MKNIFYVTVNGRAYEETESEERRDELLKVWPEMFPLAEVKAEKVNRIEVKVKYEAVFTYDVPDEELDDFDPESEVDMDLANIGDGSNWFVRARDLALETEVID